MANQGAFASDDLGWRALTKARAANAPAQGELRCAHLVIGAGFTGLSCARRLAQLHPSSAIVVLEARQLGQGASGRNSGFAVASSHFSGPYKAQNKAQYQRVNRINQSGLALLRDTVHAQHIECDWFENGFYHTAADELSLTQSRGFIDTLQALDIDHRVLDQSATKAELGSSWYRRAVHVQNGALVHPAKLVYGLADSLPQNVQLFENSAAISISPNAPFCVQTPAAKITADKLYIAANYESAKLGFGKHRIAASTLSGSFTRPLSAQELATLGTQTQWGSLSLHGGGATLRLTADQRLQIRNTAEYHQGRLLSTAQIKARQKTHRKAFENRFPQLRHVPFETAWSGVEGVTANGTNLFLNPKANVYLAGAYNGSGVTRGTAFGWALADFASHQDNALVGDCLSGAKATWLPPRPWLDLGAHCIVKRRFKGVGRDR